MRVVPVIAVCLALLNGCASSHHRVGFAAGGALPAGTSQVSTRVGVQIESDSVAGALIALGALGYWLYGRDAADSRDVRPLSAGEAVPTMDPTRSVADQDCTRPLSDRGANLRCR